MKFDDVVLESIELDTPDEIWSSDWIERQVETVYNKHKVSVGRLELMTGIKERRVYPDSFLPSHFAAQVGEKVLKKSTVSKSKVGLLIHGGVCRDRLEPATAAYVHGALGLEKSVQFFDLSNACLGFINGMTMAASMIQNKLIEAALIVTSENSRQLIENTIRQINETIPDRKLLKKYFANFTIGSGSVACVLCHKNLAPDAPRLIGGVFKADSSHNHLCEGGSNGLADQMLTDSEALLKAGIALAKESWRAFEDSIGWSNREIDHFICHQVGKMHQKALYEGLNLDMSKDFSTYETLGNTGSAALPVTLAQAFKEGILKSGEKTCLLGIGSGLSSIIMGIET